MKYELMQSINAIKDKITELDEANVNHHLINDIYDEICHMEEILQDDEDDVIGNVYREDYD